MQLMLWKMGHSQGRCSASQNQARIVASMLLLLLLAFVSLQFEKTEASNTYVVGDSSGWTYSLQGWTNGKQFKAGDTLIFNYDASIHNVGVVDVNNYKSCGTSSPSSKIYSTGKDQIKLSKEPNYFICSIPAHCHSGLKIAIYAS